MATPAASSSGSQPSAVVPVLQPDGSWAVPVSIPLPDGSSVVQWIPLAGIPAPTASPAATASSPQTAPTSAAVLPAATTSSPPTASTSAAVLPAATTSSPQAASIVAAVSAVTTPSSPQTTSTGASNVAAKSPTAGGKGEKSSNGLPVKQVHSTAGTAVSRNSAQTTSSSSPFSVAQVEASGDTNSKKPEAGPVTEARPAVPSYRAALVGGSSGSSDSKGLTGGVTPRNKGGAGGVTPWQVGVATPQKPNAVTEGTPRKGAARVATPQKGSLGESEAKPVALQQVVEIEEPRQQGAATGSTASLAVGSQEREVALQAEGLATSTSANGATSAEQNAVAGDGIPQPAAGSAEQNAVAGDGIPQPAAGRKVTLSADAKQETSASVKSGAKAATQPTTGNAAARAARLAAAKSRFIPLLRAAADTKSVPQNLSEARNEFRYRWQPRDWLTTAYAAFMRSKLDVSLFGRKRFAYAMKKVCNESNRLDAQLQKAAAADATAEPKPNVRSSDEFAFGYEPEDFLVSRPWIYYMKKAATCHHETRAKILQEFQGRRAFKMLEAYDARGVVAEVYDYQKHWPFVWQFKYADGTEEDVEEPARDTLFLKDAEEIADELSDGELEDVNEGDAATATTTATKVDNPRRGAKRKARAAYYATKASQAKSSQKQKAADSNTGADVDCGASADESEEHEEGEKWYHQPDSMWYQISDGEWISYSSTGAPQAASTSSAQGAPVQAEAHGSESGSSRALVDGHAAAHAAGKANAGATTQNTGKKTRRLRNIPWILVSHEDELAYKWFEAAKTGSEPSCRRLKEELLRRDYHIHKGGMHVYRDYRGRSALHFTAMTGNEQAVEALKDLVNCQDEEGRTPLHIAAWFGNRICCDKIIRYGADIDLVCYKGKKAIDYSRILGHRSTTQSLVRFGLAEDPKPREERRRVGEEHEPDSDDDPDEDNRDDMSECDREVDAKMDGDPDAADVVPSNPAVYKPYNGCEPFPPRQKVWSKWKGDYYRRTIVTASDGSRKKKWIKWQDHFQMHAPVLPDKGKGKKGRMMMMMGHNFKGGSYEPASASWDAEGANRYRGQLQTAGNGGNYTFYEQFSASPADPYTHGKGDGGMHSYGYYDEQANYARGSYTQHRPEAFSTPDTHPYPAWQPTPTTQDTWGAHSSSPDYYESAVGGTQHMTSRGYDQFNNPSDRRYQAYSGTAMMGYYGDAQANANSFAAGFAAGSAGAYSYPHPPTAPSATQHQMQLGPNPAEEPTAGDSWAAAASSSVSSHLQRLADAAFERAQLPAATGPLTALTQPPQPSTFLEQTAATRGLPLDFSENREREQDHSKDLVMGDGGVAERWNNMSTPPVLDSPSLQSDKGGLTPAPDAWGAANEELLFPKVAVNNQETRDAARDEYDAAMKIVEEDRERSSGSALSASTFPVVPVQEERPQSYFEQLLASAKRSEDSENGLGSTLEASCAPPTVAGEEFSREKQLPPGSPPPPPVSGPTAAPPPLPDHLRAKTPPPVPMSLYRPPPGFVP